MSFDRMLRIAWLIIGLAAVLEFDAWRRVDTAPIQAQN